MKHNNDSKIQPQLSESAVSGSVTAKDLRIGNIINHKELGIFEIDGINPHCGDFKIESKSRWVYLKNCEPIPLTEEWLLKFGFEKMEDLSNGIDNTTYVWAKEGVSFFIEPDFSFETEYLKIKIKSAHQLQNLYYSLCGVELTDR